MSDSRIGVLLLQLGTPDAPTAGALRRYLREFLSDPRVIDLPRAMWWPILNFMVLPTRPRKSAALYRKVWTPGGSPLLVITNAQAAALEERLTAARGTRLPVVVGMRYGHPSIGEALAKLQQEGVDRIVAFPLFPQYASATTGSALEQLFREVQGLRVVPSIRVVPPYYDDSSYIAALKALICDSLRAITFRPDRLLLSFHGLPKRYTVEGDPYADHCRATATRLERSLALPDTSIMLVFQSQFGREEWLQPYTDKTLEELGRSGASVAVICPGFTADCLETLEEIRLRGAEQFHGTGGKMFHAIPCLNDHPAWVEAMTTIVTRELSGWT
jgi:ferrochelatase